MVVPSQPFVPADWLVSPHLQTVWGPMVRTRTAVPLRRELLTADDGETLILDHLDGPEASPHVLLLHGLEGSSRSVYIQGLLLALSRIPWRATVLNFRSCARDPNSRQRLPVTRPRLYHSGDTRDLDLVVRKLRESAQEAPRLAVGYSLGGNVLLKWLGEMGDAAPLRAALAVSVPFDLGAGARHMEGGLGRIYVRNFLRTLRAKAQDVTDRFPEAAVRIDRSRVMAATTFFAFDDAATAPLHGFDGAGDYYARCSSTRFLSRISVPTLCLNSMDDPFLPEGAIQVARSMASSAVHFLTTQRGGHAGFVGRSSNGVVYWAEEEGLRWLRQAVE